MRCSYAASFTEPADRIWASLADAERSLAGLPGVTLAREGEAVAGTLKVSLGATQITYRVTARAESIDAVAHTAAIALAGKEARGSGTLAAVLQVQVWAEGAGSRLEVSGDVEATGRGEAADSAVWCRVLGRLVDAHAAAVTSAESTPPPPAPSVPPSPAPRPALAVAPDPTASDDHRQMIIGAVMAVVLLLVRRRRRKNRRMEGERNDGE